MISTSRGFNATDRFFRSRGQDAQHRTARHRVGHNTFLQRAAHVIYRLGAESRKVEPAFQCGVRVVLSRIQTAGLTMTAIPNTEGPYRAVSLLDQTQIISPAGPQTTLSATFTTQPGCLLDFPLHWPIFR